MEIDFERETLLTIAEACKRMPGRPSLRTVWRWVHLGVDGHRLETIKCGSRRFTSMEAIRRFVDRGTRASTPHPNSDSRREREIARAEAELARAGF